MNRRGFFAMLASLPCFGFLKKKTSWTVVEEDAGVVLPEPDDEWLDAAGESRILAQDTGKPVCYYPDTSYFHGCRF